MPDFHGEPYIYLAGLTHDSALIAWGAFYFRIKEKTNEFKLLDDEDLEPALRETIGARSKPYGFARVVVWETATGRECANLRTVDTNHCWVSGLQPDTKYSYQVFVAPTRNRTVHGTEEEWAKGVRWDWKIENGHANMVPGRQYENVFRTFPDPTKPSPPFAFAVLGDFGVGIKDPSNEDKRQREIAEALVKAVSRHNARFVLTTGDNIYAGTRFLWITGSQGDEDDDWFFTYFQPYRYILNRVPVYPSIGNHDTGEAESVDDREQLFDNLYLRERFAGEDKFGRASIGPGLFYKFNFGGDVEFLAIDTSKEGWFSERLFEHPKHFDFLERALPPRAEGDPRWRIPFSHHPMYCAGPRHGNTSGMDKLRPLFQRSGVRAMFSGHEHNFQHSFDDPIHYVLSGGGGKLRHGRPGADGFHKARTVSWAAKFNFLIVTIDGTRMTVTPYGELDSQPVPLERESPSGAIVDGPIEISTP